MSAWPVVKVSSISAPPPHCLPQNDFLYWLSSAFQTCVPTNLAFISTLLGSLSFLAWLFAQLPQIYKNYKLKSTAGLSIYFLVEWLLGDTTNLAGAILTKQATWQVLVASYYTFVDCVMVGQFIYYTKYLPRQARRRGKIVSVRGEPQEPRGPTRSSHSMPREVPYRAPQVDGTSSSSSPGTWKGQNSGDIPFGSYRYPSFLGSPREKKHTTSSSPNRKYLRQSSDATPFASPRTTILLCMLLAVLAQASPILSASDAARDGVAAISSSGNGELVGRIVSWISTALYLVSRLPQIIKNARRRSTSGLSLSLFVAAFFGNFFYSASLLTNPLAWASYPPYGYYGWADSEGSDRKTWVLLALPFWLGAAGVLSLDLTIGIQFMMYGGGHALEPKIVEVAGDTDSDDGRGREHLRSVSGWMRGWVPSPSPVRGLRWGSRGVGRIDEREEQTRPLLASRQQHRGGEQQHQGLSTSYGSG